MDNLEIERKYLIEMPDLEKITSMKHCEIWEIEQVYLGKGVRIRKIKTDGKFLYIKTQKYSVNSITRQEFEVAIDKQMYDELYKERDTNLNIINKTRYRIRQNDFTYEIDIYPFWKNQAVLEVELESESQRFPFPEFVTVKKEVTFDKNYRNYALAQNIIQE